MTITNIKINILQNPSSKVLARATVIFDSHEIRGFKILRDDKSGKDYLTPPSYYNGKSWVPLFKTTSIEEWNYLCAKVIDEFNKELINKSLLEDK